jgi:hypothetical protein
MLSGQPIERRLQLAGSFLLLGLLIEAISVAWTRPIAFVVFVAFGGVFFALGIFLYLYSLVSVAGRKSSDHRQPE